jgi:hypothetical protein
MKGLKVLRIATIFAAALAFVVLQYVAVADYPFNFGISVHVDPWRALWGVYPSRDRTLWLRQEAEGVFLQPLRTVYETIMDGRVRAPNTPLGRWTTKLAESRGKVRPFCLVFAFLNSAVWFTGIALLLGLVSLWRRSRRSRSEIG